MFSKLPIFGLFRLKSIGKTLIYNFHIAEIKLEKKGRVFQSKSYNPNENMELKVSLRERV